jgi:hypothetical protein
LNESIDQIILYNLKMGNVNNAMKAMNQMLSSSAGGGSGSDKDDSEKLPEGEKYFGFVNVKRRIFYDK